MTYHGKEMITDHPEGCVAMTWADAEAMEKLNQENSWGFSASDLLRLIADYMDANLATDEESEKAMDANLTMERIEWRLTDANFHKLCSLLSRHMYNDAMIWVANEIC